MFFYFNSIQKHLGHYWNYDGNSKPNNILQSTVGYEALMNLLADIIQKDGVNSFDKDTFDTYVLKLKNINFSDVEMYPMSTKGKNILYCTMSLAIYPSDNLNDERRMKLQELMHN